MEPAPRSPLPAGGFAWPKWALAFALVSLVLSSLVFARRGLAAIQATREAPGVALTSGCEEESLFALWRAAHGQPVYVDPQRLPYAAAYFNWLFYAGYAVPVGAAVKLAGQSSVIPVAGRLTTALGALLGTAVLGWMLRRVLGGRGVVAAGLATFVFFGPLVGWWAHTVRPDIWALTLETTALAVLLFRYRPHPFGAVVLAGLLFYGAWSCKQTYFFGLGAAFFFLLWRRRWGPAALLALLSAGLWIATFALLGPAYRAAFRGTAVTNVYYLALGFSNLRDMLVKSAPLWLLATAAWPFRAQRRSGDDASPLARDALALGAFGVAVAAPLAFAASCKLGASSYYYFTTLVMLSLFSAGLIATLACTRLVAAAFALAAGLQAVTLSGFAGKIDLTGQTRDLSAIWEVWQKQPEPRFSARTSLNLPWLNPDSPPLVIAFNYGLDRSAGRRFESDGLGGLIAAGHFRTLLLPADTGAEYDGGSLRLYSRGETAGNMTLYHRKPVPLP